MRNKRINFTHESLNRLFCESGKKRSIFYDKKQPKLACIVSPTGVKTFALHTFDRLRKKPLQRTIGRFPEVTINHAREIANKLLSQIADGLDINEAARAIREEPTLDELFQHWLTLAKTRLRTWKGAERLYALHVQPIFGSKKISSITPQQVKTWHADLIQKPRQRKINGKKTTLSKASANRCLALLRTIFNNEADHLQNPCGKVKAYNETSRDRFLQPDELQRFFSAINADKTSQDMRDYVFLSLLTGARKANVLSISWAEIDFSSSVWTIPAAKSKNKESMAIPLVQQAIEILQSRRKEATSIFVFPSHGKTGHLVEPKKAWAALVKRSGLSNLRLHDLRRTCGSYQAASGSNQAVISRSLGHKSMATTAIYTRLNLDPVRASMERAADAIFGAAKLPQKVLKMGDKND